jgi:signal transduction histidine kinase/ActR/RegA family two-component response regulator
VLRLSFRYQLGLTLIIVNVLLTAGVALVAYRAAHDAMIDQALSAVSLVAQSRERELLDMLEHRQERLTGFLESLSSLCGETGPSGRMGWEPECVRTAVQGFHRNERATATDVSYRGRRLSHVGPEIQLERPEPDQLVAFSAAPGARQYSMWASIGDLTVHAEFPIESINAIFSDRAGLDSGGEAYLTDDAGNRLTSLRDDAPPPGSVTLPEMGACLRGAAQSTQAVNAQGENVIAGLLPAAPIGGGCIVAMVRYDDATAPILRLGRLLAYASALVGLVGFVVAVVVASVATRPLKRVADAARSLAAGRFDTQVPIEGPTEVRQLGATLSNMAASIDRLLHQEQHAREDAETANRAKDDFLATLSHELRTPLNAILGWASILARSDYDKDRVRHAVHVIERNARIQSQMIEELLDVSRISAGTVQLQASDVHLASVVDAALESVRPSADAKTVTLAAQVEVPEATIYGDARRLQQVVWNLLSNAVRFTPSGGHVELTLRRIGDDVELQVSDTGCGIPPDFLPHVFERFRQADSSTTRTHGGLGLGLAIVRDLVELHGGTVRADSEGEGRGSRFTVRLPLTPPAHAAEWPTDRPAEATRLAGARVLAVDDDPDAREVLKTVLEGAGADVVTAASALDARTLFTRARPTVVVADIGMPGEDGYSLIEWIRRTESGTSHVPAVAVTARTRPDDAAQALAAGFQIHLSKPVDARRLVNAVATLVGRNQTT